MKHMKYPLSAKAYITFLWQIATVWCRFNGIHLFFFIKEFLVPLQCNGTVKKALAHCAQFAAWTSLMGSSKFANKKGLGLIGATGNKKGKIWQIFKILSREPTVRLLPIWYIGSLGKVYKFVNEEKFGPKKASPGSEKGKKIQLLRFQ